MKNPKNKVKPKEEKKFIDDDEIILTEEEEEALKEKLKYYGYI